MRRIVFFEQMMQKDTRFIASAEQRSPEGKKAKDRHDVAVKQASAFSLAERTRFGEHSCLFFSLDELVANIVRGQMKNSTAYLSVPAGSRRQMQLPVYSGVIFADIKWKLHTPGEKDVSYTQIEALYQRQWPWLSVSHNIRPVLIRAGFVQGVNCRNVNTMTLPSDADEDTVYAACSFRFHPKFVEVTYFAVPTLYQRKSYGQILHGVIMGIALSQGLQIIYVSAAEDGMRYWEKRGYMQGPNEGHFDNLPLMRLGGTVVLKKTSLRQRCHKSTRSQMSRVRRQMPSSLP